MDILRASLFNNVLRKNFGVAGPLDMRSPKMISHGLVHVATHGSIFGGKYVPDDMANENLDDWISRVYGYKNTFLHTGVTVYNTHRFAGRARPCRVSVNANNKGGSKKKEKETEFGLDNEIARGGEMIKKWVHAELGDSGKNGIVELLLTR